MARPTDPVREAWCLRFGIPLYVSIRGYVNNRLMLQLSECKSDEARRLILGVSVKVTKEYA